jgi:cobalt-zinc-cadmium efflux system protein
MHVATAHLVATGDTDTVLVAAGRMLRQEFGVDHATLQVESDARHCSELSW